MRLANISSPTLPEAAAVYFPAHPHAKVHTALGTAVPSTILISILPNTESQNQLGQKRPLRLSSPTRSHEKPVINCTPLLAVLLGDIWAPQVRLLFAQIHGICW